MIGAEVHEGADVQAQENELTLMLVVHLLETGHLCPTRGALTSPEIQHYRFPLVKELREAQVTSAQLLFALVDCELEATTEGLAQLIGHQGHNDAHDQNPNPPGHECGTCG